MTTRIYGNTVIKWCKMAIYCSYTMQLMYIQSVLKLLNKPKQCLVFRSDLADVISLYMTFWYWMTHSIWQFGITCSLQGYDYYESRDDQYNLSFIYTHECTVLSVVIQYIHKFSMLTTMGCDIE